LNFKKLAGKSEPSLRKKQAGRVCGELQWLCLGFLFSKSGGRYAANIHWTCPGTDLYFKYLYIWSCSPLNSIEFLSVERYLNRFLLFIVFVIGVVKMQ